MPPCSSWKHGVRIAFGYELVCLFALEPYFRPIDDPARVLQNIVARLLDIGERHQCEEVHFEHPDGLHFLHVELRGHILAVAGKRHVVRDRLAADDDARRVHGRVARHPFELERHIDDAVQTLIRLVDLDKVLIALVLLLLKRLEEVVPLLLFEFRVGDLFPQPLDVPAEQFADGRLAVHQFRDPVRLGKGHAKHPADVS